METRKVYLEENRDVNSVNQESIVGINLSTKSKLLPYNDISDVLNLNDLYTAERNACRKYRLILTVNPICTNVLFNNRTEVVRYEGSSATTLILGDYEPEQTTTFSVVPTEISFDTSRSSTTITIVTEGQDWIIDGLTDNDWVSVDKLYGDEGTTVVTVSVNSNIDGDERDKQFTVVGSNGDSAVVTVSQAGVGYGITVVPSEVLFNTSGGTENIKITARNQSWTITDLCDWITSNKITGKTGESTVRLTTNTNIEPSARTCEFYVVGDETGEKVLVSVTQEGTNYVLEVEPILLSFDNTGGTKELTITTENQNWEIVSKPDWTHIDQLTGTTGTTTGIRVTVEENMTGNRRKDIIVEGSFIGSKAVEVIQSSVKLTGLTASIVQPTPLIPASGGVVDCEDVSYQVIGYYDNGKTNPVETGYTIVNCNSVSADTRSATTGPERYIKDLIVDISYEDITASASTPINQQENDVQVTTTDPEKVNVHDTGWTESSMTYVIKVEPSTKTVASAITDFDVNVNASAITYYSAFTGTVWQTAVTITSAYTSGVEDFEDVTGDTIYSDSTITGTDMSARTVETKLDGGGTEWATASTVNNGISRISCDENLDINTRDAVFQYSIVENSGTTGICNVTQNPGSREVIFKIVRNGRFQNSEYSNDVSRVVCSCKTEDDNIIWSADYGRYKTVSPNTTIDYPINWYQINGLSEYGGYSAFTTNIKYGTSSIKFDMVFNFNSYWASNSSAKTPFSVEISDSINVYNVNLPTVIWSKPVSRPVKFIFNGDGGQFNNKSNEGEPVTITTITCQCSGETDSNYWTAIYNSELNPSYYIAPGENTTYPSAQGWKITGASETNSFVTDVAYAKNNMRFKLIFNITWQGGTKTIEADAVSDFIQPYSDDTNNPVGITLPTINWENNNE